jgi:hypothetical protein
MNIAYFTNVKSPYVTSFLAMALNPIAGTMILVGHERMAATYQPKTMSVSADIIAAVAASAFIIVFVLTFLDYNFVI